MLEDECLMYHTYVNNTNDMARNNYFGCMIQYLKYGTLPNKSEVAKCILPDASNIMLGDDGLLY